MSANAEGGELPPPTRCQAAGATEARPLQPVFSQANKGELQNFKGCFLQPESERRRERTPLISICIAGISSIFKLLQNLNPGKKPTCCLSTRGQPDAKEQVLANLANFAYDPNNYQYLRQLQVVDLFLDSLSEENETLVEFAIGGLCNLCSDRANKDHILQAGGILLITNCLSSPNEETVLSAVTTLMYLSSPDASSHPELTSTPVVQCMLRFSLSANTRLRNLAQIFLEDFCSPSQVAEARSWQAHSAMGIPLPRTEAPQQP
ncbi:armadillo repeat-containing protein 7-like [Sciurus carolinensis]|uniref:armadillo repeat-containing protein 7-like n=1 Tax=Sciurus carolinensis TaxID=30640 RepID=UPI001FB2C82C|nr:armadillo repeat-containing protein 7-like [Sciurus carolinensis]